MATWAKIRESWLGLIIGCVAAVLVFLFLADKDSAEAVRALPQITTCIFGFLLTLLGIILQGSSPVINMMRKNATVYNRFISFNKRIVVLSFVLTIAAFIVGYIDFSWLSDGLLHNWPLVWVIVQKVVVSLLTLGSVWLVVDLMTFVKLFYMLIKETK